MLLNICGFALLQIVWDDDAPQKFAVAHAPTSQVVESTIELPLGLVLQEEEVETAEETPDAGEGGDGAVSAPPRRIIVVDVDPKVNASASSQVWLP